MTKSKLLYLIGLLFYTIIPIYFVVINHFRHEDGGWKLGFTAILLVALIVYATIIKKMDRRVNTWDIQNVHRDKVISYRSIKTISLFIFLYLILNGIATNIDSILTTLLSVIVSMTIGYLCMLWSELI